MSAKPRAAPLPIGLFGINERSQRTLEVLFSMHGNERYRVAADEPPHAAVVDMDGPDAARLWSDYRSHYPDLPTIVISVRADAHPGAVSLKKPITPQVLLATLDGFGAPPRTQAGGDDAPRAEPPAQAGARPNLVAHVGDVEHPDGTHSATAALEENQEDGGVCGDAEDIDTSDWYQLRAIYFDPAHRFQGACRRAMDMVLKTGQIHLFSLENLEHPLVFTPTHGGQIITHLPVKRMRIFCLVPLADTASAIAPLRALPPDLAESPRMAFEHFLWEVTLWTSRGHLPEGTPLDVPLRLKRWPNFTRLTETPHAMSISALWSRQPYSLLRTCQVLGLPQRYVFTFFSAANSAGLVEWCIDCNEARPPSLGVEHRGEHDRRAPRPADENAQGERRGLLGRILSHLLHRR